MVAVKELKGKASTNNTWVLSETTNPSDTFLLTSLQMELRLHEPYEGIVFDSETFAL